MSRPLHAPLARGARRALAAPCVLALLAGPGLSQLPLQGEEQGEPRSFSIYATEAARSRADGASRHLAAGRDLDALVDLQRLIEEHAGDVLGPTRPRLGGRRSEGDVHGGAAAWARRMLFELPEDLRRRYVERNEERAGRALEAALETLDRRALTRLARRWPITRQAERAWLALGDLELELGNGREAALAWERALAVALLEPDLRADEDLRRDLDRRLEEAGVEGERARAHRERQTLAGRLASGSSPLAAPRPWVTSLTDSEVAVEPPSPEADSWDPLAINLDHPFHGQGSRSSHVLFPARWQDLLLFSTSLELVAVGAYTGEPAWVSGRAPGWDRLTASQIASFREAIERQDALIAPAVGQGVAVAALQIPLTFEQKMDYGEMSIIRQLPNRRLFAFDATTGEPLWDTVPEPDWDGESGGFATRMRIVGSPVVQGSRVLVPCARLQGRIEYHVGCFDLFSGEVLWSTAVITGQRERNMFGRAVKEYVAPPVVVSDDRVVVQTQLGTIACLDLFTGDVLWETLYEKIGLRATHSFSAPTRITYWRSAPPRVAGRTVVATPDDSEYLLGLDLDSGVLLWSERNRELQRLFDQADIDLLLGADEHTVYLAGGHVAALDFPLGVHEFGATPLETPRVKWRWPTGPGESIPRYTPQPTLTGRHVFVPRGSAVTVLARHSGSPIDSLPYLQGNLLAADGELFALRSDSLAGRFDWQRLIERAREDLSSDPLDQDAALTLADLLEKRGRSSARHARLEQSRRELEEARAVLERVAAGDGREAHPRLQARLHSVLRAEAHTLRYLGESAAAAERLTRARTLAPSREALRDVLVEELDLADGRDPAAWLELSRTLEQECGDLSLEVVALGGDPGAGGLPRLVPAATQDDEEPPTTYLVPVSLWTRLARLGREPGDELEFEDLHALLAEHGDLRLDGEPLADWAAGRIAGKLAAGERGGYERFEEEARTMLERARERGDGSMLGRVSELYPHSQAAGRANEVRLELALAGGDARTVAEIALGSLPPGWTLERASDEQIGLLARLACTLGEGGNPELRAALLERLARRAPSLRPGLPGGDQRSLQELSAAWPVEPSPAPAATRAGFGPEVHSGNGYTLRGRFRLLGEVPPGPGDPPGDDVLVFASDDRLQAVSLLPEPGPSWGLRLDERELPDTWGRSFSATPGRLQLATRWRVLCLDRAAGETLWTWEVPGLRPLRLAASRGVVLVTAESDADADVKVIAALDAAAGIELWRLRLAEDAFVDEPVVGEGYVAFLPSFLGREVVVVDLFTGSRVSSHETRGLSHGSADETWIQDGKLIVPRFLERDPEDNHVLAIDLASGRESWRLSLEDVHDGGQLVRLLGYQGETYLAIEPKGRGERRQGGIYGLDVRRGLIDASPLAEFTADDRWIGVPTRRRVQLDAPYVFLLTDRGGDGNKSLRAVHLPYGRRWDTRLRLTEDDLYVPGAMPPPALSRGTVVVAWREMRDDLERRAETVVALFDRASGELRETRTLPQAMNGNAPLVLAPLGNALVLCGADQMEIWR